MQDNGNVQQLSKALNQLLDAYEILQEESKMLKEENTSFKTEIDDLKLKNNELNTTLSELSNTTEQNSSELGTMLDRIENILGPKEESKKIEESIIDKEVESIIDDATTISIDQEINLYSQPEQKTEQQDNKEIDLGRMQSLLNGFSN